MNEVYVFDRDLNLIDVVDTFVSCIWRPAFFDVGDFELYLSASEKMVGLFKKDYRLVRKNDINIDSDGNTIYKNVMVVKNIAITTDAEDGDFLTVTGKELKSVIGQRIVWKQTNLKGNIEAEIRRLINENAINPTDVNRVIPGLVLGGIQGLTSEIEKQLTGTRIDEAIVEICKSYNYGWDVCICNDKMVFIMYEGVDRSYNQNENPFVVFSDDFENIMNTSYQLTTEDYANTTLVGGEGEGTERVFATVGIDNAGLDRYEVFTDARDLSRNTGTENEISSDDYDLLLKERGNGNLAGLGYTEGFSGEVIHNVTFKYNEDFFIGDIVTVISKYGVQSDVRVLSAIETEDENGTSLIPQFNI